MLEEILAELDGEILFQKSAELVLDTASFSSEAGQLLRKRPILDFFNIAEILIGEDAHLGAGAVLLFLKNSGKSDPWLGKALESLDKEFCLNSADLLVREGKATVGVGWNFSEKSRAMLEKACPELALVIGILQVRFGVGFTIGAYLQLELLRRKEENDFGMELGDLPIQ